MIAELETRYGRMFVPDTDRGQYWWLANTGASPEDGYIEVVCNILDGLPKGTAVDVGANFGCWTLPLAQHATRVIALEPQECVYKLLARSLLVNRTKNVILINWAAGEENGTAMIPALDIEGSCNFGGVELGIVHHEEPDAPMREVPVFTLDQILEREKHVSFIKADVEGSEMRVLRGAMNTIKRYRPVMFVEALHPRTDSRFLANFVQHELNYSIEPLLDNFLAMPL